MRQIYTLLIIALFNLNTFAQTEILGEWFLHEFVDLDVVIPNEYSPQISILFSEDSEYYSYSGIGVCNAYGSDITYIQENTFEAFPPYWTLVDCDYNPSDNLHEYMYNNLFQYNYNPQNATEFEYTITGSGQDAVLVISNSVYDEESHTNIGYTAVYGRQILSVTENKLTAIKLKENPVKNSIHLITKQELSEELHFTIYSIDGKPIITKSTPDLNTINVDFLNPGIYFLSLQLENKSKVIKFVKE